MPIQYTIDRDLGLVRETAWGTATREDFEDLIQRLVADPEFHPGMSVLCDFESLEFDLPTEDIEAIYVLMERHAEAFGDSRFAVVTSGDLEFGLTRMFGMISSGAAFETQVFRSLVEAGLWLGISGLVAEDHP